MFGLIAISAFVVIIGNVIFGLHQLFPLKVLRGGPRETEYLEGHHSSMIPLMKLVWDFCPILAVNKAPPFP